MKSREGGMLESTRESWSDCNLGRWLKSFIAAPPALPVDYDMADFAGFMRKETYLYTPRYAKKYVVIHGQENLRAVAAHSGALLAPLHYGSFFLAGGAIVHQLKMPYTAIVTNRNFAILPIEEQQFWRGVHQRSEYLYGQTLFRTGTHPKGLVSYLRTAGNLLGATLDVREVGLVAEEYPFDFLQKKIYLSTGPARLAFLAKVPVIPMTIQYNVAEQRHHLYLDEPIYPSRDHVETTQRVLSSLEFHIAGQPRQFFHDLLNGFALPHHGIAAS